MKKLLVVSSIDESSWESCKVIVPNLKETYGLLREYFEVLFYEYNSHDSELIEKIESEKPDQLVFIDHVPCPATIISALIASLELTSLPPITIHVFGDFTYFANKWITVSPLLKTHPVKFIVASDSQKNLLSYFLEDAACVERFHFPINRNDFFFDAKERQEIRQKYNILDHEKIILYSGRLSLQKNVDILVQEYLKLTKNTNDVIHLWVMGSVDDIGAPYLNSDLEFGYLFSKIESIIRKHLGHHWERIKFWGFKNKEDLRKIKAASDLFISLSLYHDEDFGMSPAEALACGLPSLLTDWGGYSSFISSKWLCHLIPVKITEHGQEIRTKSIPEFYEKISLSVFTDAERKKRADLFLDTFSISSSVDQLVSILQTPLSPFRGFNFSLSNLTLQAMQSKLNPQFINFELIPSDKNFYSQVYKNYISMKAPSNLDGFTVVQWLFDILQSSRTTIKEPDAEQHKHYLRLFSPFTEHYYSSLNSCFLITKNQLNQQQLNKRHLTLRDGSLPLHQFFSTASVDYIKDIIINKDFWYLVPKNWRNKTKYYEIRSDITYRRDKKPKNIFIAIMLNDLFASFEFFKKKMEQLKVEFGEDNLKHMRVSVFMQGPLEKTETLSIRKDTIEITRILLTTFNFEITFLTSWAEVKAIPHFNETLYFEVNERIFIDDTYVSHYLLSHGAGTLDQGQSKERLPQFERIDLVKLSPFHHVNIYSADLQNWPEIQDPLNSSQFKKSHLSLFKEMSQSRKSLHQHISINNLLSFFPKSRN